MNYPCKVVLNKCCGGFGLSARALLYLYNRGMTEIAVPLDKWFHDGKPTKGAIKHWEEFKKTDQEPDIWNFVVFVDNMNKILTLQADGVDQYSPEFRSNPLLVECVEVLGKASYGYCAKLLIVNACGPFQIEEYYGMEICEAIHEIYG